MINFAASSGIIGKMRNYIKDISDWYFTKKALPYWGILLLDCLGVTVGYFITLSLIRFIGESTLYDNGQLPVLWGYLISAAIYCIYFRVFRTYAGVIRYSNFKDLHDVILAVLLASLTGMMVSGVLLNFDVKCVKMFKPLGFFVLFSLSTLGLIFMRMIVRMLFERTRSIEAAHGAFIYGVLEGGISLAKSLINQDVKRYELKGFVSPTGDFVGQSLLNVRVYADDDNLLNVMKEQGVTSLLVSPAQTNVFRERQNLISLLIEADIKILVVPDAEEWDGKTQLSHTLMHEVEIEDLLPRDVIDINMAEISDNIRDKRVFISGAAGSIGSEMVRQIAHFKPAEMVLVDQAETPMHDIRLMMADKFPKIKAYTIVGSITNKELMESIFKTHKIDYLLHAAAYKHVPMMEDNPAVAIQNNVVGTRILADLAVKYNVGKFVMISTDKAVNPTNVMGCSKRICEIYCQALNAAIVSGKVKGVTQFVTTRFGNVLGSNGSVIPHFREQIKNGGPITVTDPNIERFFMLIPEACKLVLEAGTMGKGGEIYVFDMGKPVKIVDLAKRMIQLSGARDIKIVFTGLRDGEKLYEEVLASAENTKPTEHPKIMIAKVREYDYETACRNEERLLEASYSFDDMEVVRIMKEIVPEYKSNSSKYVVLDQK